MNSNATQSRKPPAVARPGVFELVSPFWRSERRWMAFLLVAILLGNMFGTAWLAVRANQLLGAVTDALVGRQWATLPQLFVASLVVGVTSGAIYITGGSVQEVLNIRWRTWLTDRLLRAWTAGHVSYDIEREGLLGNADQRIAEDVRLFVTETLNLTLNTVRIVVRTVTYSYLLYVISGTLWLTIGGRQWGIPGYMVWIVFAYAALELAITHRFGKAMIGLIMRKQTVEADFRYLAMQQRDNAEQIAFYGGGERERSRLRGAFEQVRGNVVSIIVRNWKVDMARNVYGRFFENLPTIAALPLYLAGRITFGGLTSAAHAFMNLRETLNYFAQAYVGFTEWMAVTNRLRDLVWAIRKAEHRSRGFVVQRAPGLELATDALTLRDPHGATLTTVPALRIGAGERWLVRGPSGVGKSTLLRAIAGIWPHGEGRIVLPADGSLMFLPQRSYIPAGSLKAAICYPAEPAQFDDARCRDVLAQCGLAARAASLTETDAWQQKLSGGEQQRIAIARALLHRPDFLFLDEATSALDPETEQRLYRLLVDQLPRSALVSVAHRESLAQFHDRVVVLDKGDVPDAPERAVRPV